ncbi:hypothetical protein BCV72DRAFT_319456 [Rhizopus microsporus var. microsporus]|uniref:Uncharacterized protein n=1 Tax=Rhizopus microsporus var. microsporus TaxID=86635 RepID=A0A1X0QQH6_RHIZD|nr:hypothetical protein BCV72DRAFT_319456 [Rhizopus microsporus var. microsporus]
MTKFGRPAQAPIPKVAILAAQVGVSIDSIVTHGSWTSRDIFGHHYRLFSTAFTGFSLVTLD